MADSLTAQLFSFLESSKRKLSDQFSQASLETTAEKISDKLKNPEKDIGSFVGMTGTIGSAVRVLGNEAAFKAQNLLSKGKNSDEVFASTKVYQQPLDKQLRANISDEAYKLKDYVKAKTLGEAISHPELFKYYPELQDIGFKVGDLPKGARAAFKDNTITVSKDVNPLDIPSSVLHEVQHAIQKKEGFTQGSSVQAMSSSPTFLRGMSDSQTLQELAAEKVANKDPRSVAQILAEKLYRLVGGEAEARAVQKQLENKDWTSNPYQQGFMDVDPNALIKPR